MTGAQTPRAVTLLTALLSVVWAVSMLVRIANPAWTGGTSIDSLMVVMCGYYFATKREKP